MKIYNISFIKLYNNLTSTSSESFYYLKNDSYSKC